MNALTNVLRGFLMGSADLVPGVSGGTVALVLGIYERLVGAIGEGSGALGALAKGDGPGFVRRMKLVDWAFLIPLVVGIGSAVVILAGALTTALEEQPVLMSALFFGLVGGSIPVAWGYLKAPERRHLAIAAVVAVALALLLGLRGGSTDEPALPLYFVAGSIAICAMILPGVSGSFLLVMMGMYDAVLGAVHDRDVTIVATFGLGAVVGLALFSTALQWLLRNHHDRVLAALVGLMVGSLRVLWPWPHADGGVEDVALGAPDGQVGLALVVAIVAVGAVMALGKLGRQRESATTAS